MADKYLVSEAAAAKLSQAVGEGKSLEEVGASESINNLLAAGLQQVLNLASAQRTELDKCQLSAGEERNEALGTAFTNTQRAVKQVNLALYQQQARQDGNDILARSLLVDFYDYKNEQYTKAAVKDSDVKSLKIFTGGKGHNTDWEMEELLSSLASAGQTLGLNDKGLVAVLLSKLSGSALQIMRGQMILLGKSQETVCFEDLQRIAESSFMSQSDPKSAHRALQTLQPLSPTSTGFLELEATIIRWTRLALKDISNETERRCLFASRSEEAFMRCISRGDLTRIERKNLLRAEVGETSLNLHGMVRYLLNQHRVGSALTEPEDEDSTVRMAAQAQEGPADFEGPEGDQLYWAQPQRGGLPSRRGFRGQAGRGAPPNRRGFTPRQRGTFNNPGGRGRPAGGAFDQAARELGPNMPGARPPWRAAGGQNGPFQGRGWRGSRGRGDGPSPGRGWQGPQRGRGFGRQLPYNCRELGVAENHCFACGLPKSKCYGFKSRGCIYAGTPLGNTRCRNAGCRGCHLTRHCVGIINEAAAAWRNQEKQSGPNQNMGRFVQEEDEYGSCHENFEEVDHFLGELKESNQ